MSALHKESYLKAIDATNSGSARRLKPLSDIKVPVLLVYGGDDTLTTPALGRQMHDEIAGSEFLEIPHAGHLSNLEAAEIFNREVLAFTLRHRDLAA
jgi:pimeloyl-ACP methyl ester carboxylesterase